MADVYWEVPDAAAFVAVGELLQEHQLLTMAGDTTGAAELRERLRSLPGFPHNGYNPAYDTVNVVIRNTRITFTRALPGLPGAPLR